METTTVGTVMVTGADFDVSVTEVAVMVTFRTPAGGLAGALYVTAVLLALLRVPAPDDGDMAQVTPLLVGSLFATAAIGSVPAACTMAVAGDAETVMAETVTLADPDLEVLATAVALMVTAKSLGGGVVGAVYVTVAPLKLEPGDTFPHCEAPHDTLHVTPLFDGSLFTVAEIGTPCVACAVVKAAETETVIASFGGGPAIAGPPPQPVMKVPKVNPRSATAK